MPARLTAGSAHSAPDMDVAIVGTGFSGLGMGIKLKEAGFTSFTIFEKADEIGGTWRDNHYPGCACDVPSYLYSYSFEPNPYWSKMYAPQPEIWRYMKHCADKYGLYPYIRFNSTITGAHFDEAAGFWRVQVSDGSTHTARVLVSGAGGLSIPAYPDIPGSHDFQGTAFHSAHWLDDYDFDGRDIAVIGTGASAVQFVPELVDRVKSLTLYQRTPPWILPKPDRTISQFEHWLFSTLPFTQRLFRAGIYWMMEARAYAFLKDVSWMKSAQGIAERHLEDQVPDAALRAKLTPDYTLGCKRVLISNDYFPALQRDNVELVTDGIASIRPHGVATRDGRERSADTIVYGTGFKAMEPLSDLSITGRAGQDLAQTWTTGPEAYLGITVTGFPNFFMLMGPNTGLGHNSMIYMIESQIQYVVESLKRLESGNARFMDLKPGVQAAFNKDLQEKMQKTVWIQGGCDSWYLTDEGHNSTLWPDYTFRYRNLTRQPALEDYELVG